MDREEALKAREKALEEKEKRLEQKERELDAFSARVRERKEEWYEKVPLNTRQLTVIIGIVYVLLGIVALLIILEAAGIFRL